MVLPGSFKQLVEAVHLSKAKGRMFLMVRNAYLDESSDPKPPSGVYRGFFAVGGIIGNSVASYELERNWEKKLEKYDLEYFKASECENGWRQFQKFVKDSKNITPDERSVLDSISLDFISLIINPVALDPKSYLACWGVGVKQDDFYEVIKDDHSCAVLGRDPYRLAYDFAFIEGAWIMKEMGEEWSVHYICDEHEKYSPLAPEAYRSLKKKNPNAAHRMLSFSSIDEKNCAPVQAADAVIYEIRRALNFQHKVPGLSDKAIRPQFKMLADTHMMAYVAHTSREQLEWIAANHQPGQPFHLDEIFEKQMGEDIDELGVRKV